MKIGLYPGCSLDGSSREYRESVLAMCKATKIDIHEIPDWNCCGATAAHNLNHDLALALPARIIAIAEREGMKQILVPCAACYSRLSSTVFELKKDKAVCERIAGILEMPLTADVEIINILQFIDEHITPHVQFLVNKPFSYKVACYYGCLMVRPKHILKYDRVEDPRSMDIIMEKLGAEPLEWPFKTECCGAGFSVSRTDLVGKLSGKIVEDAVARGAEAIIVACPMCHSNLDMRRPEIENYMQKKCDVPVLYISQVIGMALGVDPNELGLDRHFVPVKLKSTEYKRKVKSTQVTEEK